MESSCSTIKEPESRELTVKSREEAFKLLSTILTKYYTIAVYNSSIYSYEGVSEQVILFDNSRVKVPASYEYGVYESKVKQGIIPSNTFFVRLSISNPGMFVISYITSSRNLVNIRYRILKREADDLLVQSVCPLTNEPLDKSKRLIELIKERSCYYKCMDRTISNEIAQSLYIREYSPGN